MMDARPDEIAVFKELSLLTGGPLWRYLEETYAQPLGQRRAIVEVLPSWRHGNRRSSTFLQAGKALSLQAAFSSITHIIMIVMAWPSFCRRAAHRCRSV